MRGGECLQRNLYLRVGRAKEILYVKEGPPKITAFMFFFSYGAIHNNANTLLE